MKYKVIYPFIDKDKKFWLGDIYTSDDPKRIKQLTSKNNNLKRVLIEPVKEEPIKADTFETKRKVDGAPETKKETDTE